MASKRFKRKIGETPNPMVNKKSTAVVPATEPLPIVIQESYFEFLKGFDKLEVRDKDIVINETKSIFAQHAKFKQTMAVHLMKVRDVLLPRRMYETYLAALGEQKIISRATANRYVRDYEYLQAQLPAQVFAMAIKEDAKINLALIEHIPPPKGDNEEENKVWLERVTDRDTAKAIAKSGSTLDDYNVMLKNNIAQIKNDYNKLPNNAKTRQRWITDLCGMILWTGNIQTAQTIAPQAIPEKLATPRGRPKGSTKGS